MAFDTGGGLFFEPTTDAALISRLAIESYCANYLHLWEDKGAWYLENSFSVKNLEKEIQNIDNQFFIIYEKFDSDKKSIGFLKLRPDLVSADTLELERIYLVADASGKGVGTAALAHVEAWAQTQGFSKIVLKAMDSSANAIRFYEKSGFKIVGKYELTFSRLHAHLRGMVVMEKILMSKNGNSR